MKRNHLFSTNIQKQGNQARALEFEAQVSWAV